MVDSADADPKKLITGVPSPFARIHLFDSAFGFVNRQVDGEVDHSGQSLFHRTVSECLDVLELVFDWSTHSSLIQLRRWNPTEDLRSLEESEIEGQTLLAEVLKLFIKEDSKTANFELIPYFLIVLVNHEVLAISSPLTFFITSPKAASLSRSNNLRNSSTGGLYFDDIRPLHTRADDFQLYLHWLFFKDKDLRSRCSRMHEYLVQSLKHLETDNKGLMSKILRLEQGGAPEVESRLEAVQDANHHPVEVLGVEMCMRSQKDTLERVKQSPLVVKSSRQRLVGGLGPLVLEPRYSSLGEHDGTTKIPDVAGVPLEDRRLPDLGVRYPFLVAEDFIEDKIIRLPFKMNNARFVAPQGEGFQSADDWSFLLPLKHAFFEYFEPKEVQQMTKFIRTQDGQGVKFELNIPTQGRKVKFTKTFYDSPQLPGAGVIVKAEMNCAIFPFVVVPAHAEFSDRYWVMLVDGELEPSVKSRSCFDLRFYAMKNDGFVLISENQKASQYLHVTKRSDKELQAGSTYFEIRGGHFDYIQVEAFASDPTDLSRHVSGIIVPRWEIRNIGMQDVAVAIDFGTTNTHVAWTRLGNRPHPEVLAIEERDLQMALLSAPRVQADTESAKFDTFEGRLADFEVRLHHEFLPSILGPKAPFRFPLRTATSERPNLQPGEYHALGNINVSFVFGVDVRRPDERITTDLKWSLAASESTRERVEAFIRELLVIVRTKLILNDADPNKCRIVWFRPLSFDEFTRSHFERIWADAVSDVLHIPSSQVQCMTESEAPYYYHNKAATIITSKPVLCIDIGGGSTDVVVFDRDGTEDRRKTPKVGTSFSFAGNALWGAGYDQVGHSQTGVVRKYGKWLEDRVGQISDPDIRRRISGVFTELQKSQSPSEEFLNFFFAIDKEVKFAQKLSEDSWVRCLVWIHFSAIVFHCAQVMKALGMSAPEVICFSGRGARSIEILDVGPGKLQVKALTQSIFARIYEEKNLPPVRLILAADSKEATCNGGMLKDIAIQTSPETVVSIGDGTITTQRPTYAEISQATKEAVVDNLGRFVACLQGLSEEGLFREKFGIDVDFSTIARVLMQNIGDCIDLGLERHGYAANPTEKVNETLFFYPLIQKLFEIGNMMPVDFA
jgi:hypothetical protein